MRSLLRKLMRNLGQCARINNNNENATAIHKEWITKKLFSLKITFSKFLQIFYFTIDMISQAALFSNWEKVTKTKTSNKYTSTRAKATIVKMSHLAVKLADDGGRTLELQQQQQSLCCLFVGQSLSKTNHRKGKMRNKTDKMSNSLPFFTYQRSKK